MSRNSLFWKYQPVYFYNLLQNQKHNSRDLLAQLAKRLAKGEESAIAQIYELTYTQLVYFGLQIAGPHQQTLVEGVVQDLFIWLAKNYKKVETVGNFEAYLYQATRTNIKQKLQAIAQKKAAAQRYQLRTAPNQDTSALSPENTLIQKEKDAADKQLINKYLGQLPDYQKEAIYLRFYENRSYKDVAEILSTNTQVARNYVFRALTTLRKKLK